jgi:hypothetical protein
VSASIQPASGLSAWRIVVIGLVAVLSAGIGVALGGFLLNGRDTGALGASASYVPADAPFYVELRVEPSAEQDAALRELLGRFPPIEGIDLDRPLYSQLGELIDEQLAAEGETDLSWSEDVAPWFDGRLALGVTDLPIDELTQSTDPMAEPPVPGMIAIVGVTDRGAAQATLDRLTEESEAQGLETIVSEHRGVSVYEVSDEQGAYALTDDVLLIGPDTASVTSALDTAADPTQALAGDDGVAAMVAELPDDCLAFITYDLTELLSAGFAEAEGSSDAAIAAFQALMEHQPMRGAMAISAAGDRIAGDAVSEASTGPFAVENVDRGLAEEVPGDALYYAEGGNIGAALAAYIEAGKLAAAEDPAAAEQIDTAEAALGAELEGMVVWIDDGAMVGGWNGSESYAGLVLIPNDMDSAERRIAQLVTFANLATLDPSTGISVEESDVAGTTVATIRWAGPEGEPVEGFGEPIDVTLQVAVTDDRVVLGYGETFVGRVLELDPSASLATEPRFTEAVADLGPVANAGVAWVDLVGVREAIETSLEPMIEMIDPEGSYTTEILPWLMPLDRAVTVTTLEGELLVQRSALLIR